ncbi:MAG TPA: hypothetical protein VGM39_01590 [Kofleriaceae bacterium]
MRRKRRASPRAASSRCSKASAISREERKLIITTATARTTKPGQAANGFASFDAMLEWTLEEVATPLAGEVMSIGYVDGAGEYQRMSCFTYGGGTTTCP